MYFGYNTNGFAHHRFEDAIAILADLGYRGIAITVDYHALDPKAPDFQKFAERVRRTLRQRRLRCVVETGARFLLDPRRKHQPTLLSPTPAERFVRIDFLKSCVELAAHFEADAVSFWSGAAIDAPPENVLWDRLTESCQTVMAAAQEAGVKLAFEPEPGMFVDTMTKFEQLLSRLHTTPAARDTFGLTLDVGHLHCLGETPIADQIERWRSVLWNVHLDDMRKGVHDHLMFGDGEIDFVSVLRALEKIDYSGGAYVELSRHAHDAVRVAEKSLSYLQGISSPSESAPESSFV
jgi:L-ribulose-5-phosphate 3-epimerase